MKQPTYEAAKSLGLHPANLMLYLIKMGFSFEDVWPEIEENWIEAVRSEDWQRFGRRIPLSTNPAAIPERNNERLELPIDQNAALIIEKLWRNDKWGNAYVSVESLHKHTHLQSHQLDLAIRELIKKGFLIDQGNSGPYSLNTGKRAEIERIAGLMVHRNE